MVVPREFKAMLDDLESSIDDLIREHENELEKVKQESYDEGYEKGYADAEREVGV